MGLEVVSLDMRPYDMERALVRNISKVHPALLFIDLLLGLFMERRPNMRFLDTSTQCEVVDTEVADLRRRRDGRRPRRGSTSSAHRRPGVTVDAAPPPCPRERKTPCRSPSGPSST